MALTLREAITATQTTIDITGMDELNAGDVWSVDSEYLKIHGEPFFPAGQSAYQRASVKRGVQGTPKASHAAGAGLTNRLPGSGGTSVHGELDEREAADGHPIAAVTGLEAALAAKLPQVLSPAADLDADLHTTATATGAGQAVAGAAAVADGTADASNNATGTDAIARASASASSGGNADVTITAEAAGGNANADQTATATGGIASAVATATAVGGSASIGPVADATTALIMVTGIPTSDPVVAGALYTNAGVVMVSEG